MTPFSLAVIVAVSVEATPLDVTVNVAVVAPAATVTEPGTLASALLLLKVTTEPLAGAALANVTVPVELAPPKIVVGLSETLCRPGGLIVSVA